MSRRSPLFVFAAIAGLLATQASATECPATGPDGPLALHKAWLMQGWERHETDPAFHFVDKMQRYYDLNDRTGVFFDNFAPGPSQLFHDSVRYGTNWEDLQNAARTVRHGLTDKGDALIDRSVASTTLGFVGRIDRKDGQVVAFDGRSQLGWKCTHGHWKIHHELNFATIVAPEAVAPFLGKAP